MLVCYIMKEGMLNRTEPTEPNRLILEPAGTGRKTKPNRTITQASNNTGRTASNRETYLSEPNRTEPIQFEKSGTKTNRTEPVPSCL